MLAGPARVLRALTVRAAAGGWHAACLDVGVAYVPLRAKLLLSLSLCAACPEPPHAAEQVPRADVSPPPEVPVGTSLRMQDHFDETARLRDAVIDGDLPAVRAAARKLRASDDPVPPAWQAFVTANMQLAEAASSAKDLAAAARAAAGLADTCGDCHASLGAGPHFPPAGPVLPVEAHDVGKHMARHQWASERMWEGLVSHGEAAWAAGAAALSDAPLSARELTANVELPGDALELGDRVHALGLRARQTAEWPARASLYGELLATCATCHRSGC